MTKDFIKAFGVTVRDQIIMKNSVEIKGLGIFTPIHITKRQEKRADGTLVMLPPKDSIEFTKER